MRTQTYYQLSAEERDTIAYKYALGASLGEIARALGRNKSTISRELCRNKAPVYDIYLANRAQQRVAARQSEARQAGSGERRSGLMTSLRRKPTAVVEHVRIGRRGRKK
jgi:IS30 family transposase